MAFSYALEFSTQAYFPMKYSNQISVSNENQDEVLMKFMKFLLICESAMFSYMIWSRVYLGYRHRYFTIWTNVVLSLSGIFSHIRYVIHKYEIFQYICDNDGIPTTVFHPMISILFTTLPLMLDFKKFVSTIPLLMFLIFCIHKFPLKMNCSSRYMECSCIMLREWK